MKNTIFTFALLVASFWASAQYEERDANRIGISVGANQFTLSTDNFNTKPGIGWTAGLSVRGNFYNDFDMVYDIRFSENRFSINTVTAIDRELDVKIHSAQISLLLSYKIVENHLSVELGPMFQFNGKLDIADEDLVFPIDNNGTTAQDIRDIGVFNFYPTLGVTGGIKHVRAHIFAQYGVTNMLRGLDKAGGGDLNGHGIILGGNLCFYL